MEVTLRNSIIFIVIFINIYFFSFAQIPSNYFIKNQGQWDENIKYILTTKNTNLIVTNEAIYFDMYSIERMEESYQKFGTVTKFKIQGGKFDNFQEIRSADWKLNFFKGNNPNKWVKGIQGFEKIKITSILPNIDLLLHSENEPRYDFIVYPKGDPHKIIINIEGAKIVKCEEDQIVFETALGNVIHRNLFAYQLNNNQKTPVLAKFKKINDNTFGFEVKDYDRTKSLIIDPLVFSSLLGGSNAEEIIDIVEPSTGTIIITGWTESYNFPTIPGSYSNSYNGEKDIFISKINVRGAKRELVSSTILGGSSNEHPVNLVVDNDNNIYVGAVTNSGDLPLVNALSKSPYGLSDAYFIKFNPDCNEIFFCSYFGGSKDDILTAVKLASDKGLYLVGYTNSSDLPVTGGAYQNKLKGKNDIFFAKVSNTGQSIKTCTYIGGIEDDFAYDMCVTPSEYIYIGGATKSNDFPAFPVRVYNYGNYEYVLESPFDRTYNGNFDGVIIKILGSSGGLEYASFFGGLADDFVTTVNFFGSDEKVVFAGKTLKEPSITTFPLSQTAYQNSIKGQEETFVASLSNIVITTQYNWTYKSQNLVFSTFLGGSGTDVPKSITFNKKTQTFYIVGNTTSTNFPIVNNPTGKKLQKNDIYFVSMLNDGSSVSYSNIIGGNDDDIPNKIIVNNDGDYYIVGKTYSTNFPIINPISNTSTNSFPDGFVLKNVDVTLRIEAPLGKEEFCPKTNLTIKWSVEGITQPDSFDVEIRHEESNFWIPVALGIKGLSTTIVTPEDRIGKVWIRVSHPRGLVAIIQEPILILEPPKLISFYPEVNFLELCEGESILLTIEAVGSKLKYQWSFNNQPIENWTTDTLILENLKPIHSGKYKIKVSGACPPNIESNEITLNILPQTKILSQSSDTTIKLGEPLFLFIYSDENNLKYQWYKNNSRIIGENQCTLKIQNVSVYDEGNYFCIVDGSCGSDTSEIIYVHIDTSVNKVQNSTNTNSYEVIHFENKLIINVNENNNLSNLYIKIYDLLGNIIFTEYLPKASNERILIDISNFVNGTYILNLETESGFENILFIKHY